MPSLSGLERDDPIPPFPQEFSPHALTYTRLKEVNHQRPEALISPGPGCPGGDGSDMGGAGLVFAGPLAGRGTSSESSPGRRKLGAFAGRSCCCSLACLSG